MSSIPGYGNDADNARRWDGEARGHYEVWYLTCNHVDSNTGYWIRYTLESPHTDHGEPYAQLWFAHFDANDSSRTFAINRKFPIETMVASRSPFEVAIGDSVLHHDAMRGSLAGDGHEVSWDLEWSPGERTHRHLPDVMYRRGGLGETTVLSPSVNTSLSGAIIVDGRTLDFVGDPAGQTTVKSTGSTSFATRCSPAASTARPTIGSADATSRPASRVNSRASPRTWSSRPTSIRMVRRRGAPTRRWQICVSPSTSEAVSPDGVRPPS